MPENLAAVGFVGLGNMGTPMTARLVEAGYRVRAYDVSEDARARASSLGAEAVDSLADTAAEADAVILMLPSSAVVDSVLDDSSFTGSLRPGTIVIDMSSSEPLKTRENAARLAALSVPLIDAPVSGGVKGATNGTLTIMVGGPDEVIQRVTGLLATLGTPVHAGDVGAGHAIKALNNLLSATHLWVTSEAMVAGERFGLDREAMLSILNGSSGRSGSTDNKWPNFILPGTYDSGFGLRLMLKDMRIATELAAGLDAPTRLGEATVALWDRASEDLEPTADHTEVARWIEQHTDEDSRE